MFNKIKVSVVLAFAVFFGQQAQAQLEQGSHEVGVRFGSATGVAYRYSLQEDRALEGIFTLQSSSRESRFRFVGLYQYHKPITENFSWFYGFGGSFGSVRYKAYTNAAREHIPSSSNLLLSLDGVVGVNYNIPDSPIALTLDLKPYIDFLQESSIKWIDPLGFTVRYKF